MKKHTILKFSNIDDFHLHPVHWVVHRTSLNRVSQIRSPSIYNINFLRFLFISKKVCVSYAVSKSHENYLPQITSFWWRAFIIEKWHISNTIILLILILDKNLRNLPLSWFWQSCNYRQVIMFVYSTKSPKRASPCVYSKVYNLGYHGLKNGSRAELSSWAYFTTLFFKNCKFY